MQCSRHLLKAVIILLPLLGLTWIIGILSINNDTQVFAWIFAILNSLQVNTIDSYILDTHCEIVFSNVCNHFMYKIYINFYLGCFHLYISCAKK